MDKEKLLNNLQYDNSRAEEFIYAYAREKGLKGFMEKWESKPYTDDDYTLVKMLADLFAEIDNNFLVPYMPNNQKPTYEDFEVGDIVIANTSTDGLVKGKVGKR